VRALRNQGQQWGNDSITSSQSSIEKSPRTPSHETELISLMAASLAQISDPADYLAE